ncbi:MAG: ABC transporter ATP-binding protein [Rhodospirillales bacterium]|nr:MAG: ABC transporter ATP-binding protein [Rhodospirillales bacterium]
MNDVVIRTERLGKKYVIGHEAERERYQTLRDMLARQARGLARSAADIVRGRPLIMGDEREEFWALKDVSFEVRRGEVIGIIGRNGAGKSTLLKVLSRITEPTEGRVTIEGRVASLLEVGTGFHPELSGRENIYLNGAILGMTRAEIRRKFDEIVAFAGVEQFLDTPVKRYSSGMYVRLAFAVAAHLEPEILIVDEVLAVGDAEFQKKCLGKMQDVAGHGRTVLFVSHNMTAVQSLCSRAMLIRQGLLAAVGATTDMIGLYLSRSISGLPSTGDLAAFPRKGKGSLSFRGIRFLDGDGRSCPGPVTGKPCIIQLAIDGTRSKKGVGRLGLGFADSLGHPLFLCANEASNPEPIWVTMGTIVTCRILRFPLTEGRYQISLFLEVDGIIEDWITENLSVDVRPGSFFGTPSNAPKGWSGKGVLVPNEWFVDCRADPTDIAAE